ncbi:hypothetical protein EDC04DRAFT_622333 [Pisolithus marmoratus]|nr:hypothetical protein EDC04DRAFT_622333 [Pisolithus marmoratus]
MKRKLAEREQDLVEDSEPEREERRRQHLERQCHRKPTASTGDRRPGVVQCDSPSLPSSLHGQIDKRLTLEFELKNTIGGHEERGNELREPSVTNATARHQPILNRRCPSLPLITTIEECRFKQNDEVDELGCMQICHFAYQPPKYRAPSHGASFPERQPDPSPMASGSHVELSQFLKQSSDRPSDAEISALSKCVCCGLQWTTKKTVKQKRMHIETCSRKHAIFPGTLLSLINKEASESPLQADSSNECQPSPEAHSESPATLMGTIVSAEPGRRSRRKPVISTVKTLPETRKSIIGKARDLLGQSADPQGEDINRLCTDSDEVKPTQQFGTSMLARRNDVLSRQEREIQTPVMEAPPSTQTFGESVLGGKRTTNRMLDAYYNATSVATMEIQL